MGHLFLYNETTGGCMAIIRKDLPLPIRGTVVKKDGEYCIIINARYNHEIQELTLLHELKHIDQDDFDKSSILEAEKYNVE